MLRRAENQVQFRVYLDTSVFGGCFDRGFEAESLRLIRYIHSGYLTAVISESTIRELQNAPQHVISIMTDLPMNAVEFLPFMNEAVALQKAYLADGIVGARWAVDALHVASATVSRANAIVSWNFRHIVRLDKILAFNATNTRLGYDALTIVSPREVSFDE